MPAITLNITRERLEQHPLTVDDYIDLEEGKLRPVREIMCRFVVDPDTGQFVDIADARKIIGKMPLDESFSEMTKGFLTKLKDAQVPPGKGGA